MRLLFFLYSLLFALVLTSSCTLTGDCIQDPEKYPVWNSFDDFTLDDEGHLNTHVLLIPLRCKGFKTQDEGSLESRQTVWIGEKVAEAYNIGKSQGAKCPQYVCVGIGLGKDYLPDVFLQTDIKSKAKLSQWFQENCQKIEVGWINYWHKTNDVHIMWIDYQGNFVDIGTIKHGERNTQWRSTFLGHRFAVKDFTTNKVIQEYTAYYNGFYLIGEREPLPEVEPDHVMKARERHAKNLDEFEWTRARRVKRTFTELGFAKGRVPDYLIGHIFQYFHNNKKRMSREEWQSTLTYVNHWENEVLMTYPSWIVKRYWHTEFQKLLEEWCDCPLNPTDLYGIRTYTDGHWLKMHVDREDTHAVSCIVNVDQVNMREPWLLKVFDIFEQVHWVEMDVGDMVYYESAKVMHGRPLAMQGEQYTNFFVHFQPSDLPDGQWRKWWRHDGPLIEKPRTYLKTEL